jgi:hypothetical protein
MPMVFLFRRHCADLFITISAAVFLVSCSPVLRPAEAKTTIAIITNKTFKPASTYWQSPGGIRSGFREPNEIPIAESIVFEISAEGLPDRVRYSLNTVAAKQYDVGQKVQIEYVERVIPLMWRHIYLTDMRPAE